MSEFRKLSDDKYLKFYSISDDIKT